MGIEISKSTVENIVVKTTLIRTVDYKLNLAVSDIVDSIFYSNILKFDNEGSSIYINQLFEYGAFQYGACYNQARFISLIMERMNVNVISFDIDKDFDVNKKRERDGLQYKERRNGKLTYSPSFPDKLCTTVVVPNPEYIWGYLLFVLLQT